MKNKHQNNTERQVTDDYMKDSLALIFMIGLMISGALYIMIQLIHPR